MKKINLITVLILLILMSGIGIVSAVTVTGHLGTSGGWTSSSYTNSYAAHLSLAYQPHYLRFNNVQNAQGFISVIFWSDHPSSNTYDAGSPAGTSTLCELWTFNSTTLGKGDTLLGTGTIGYQRNYVGGSESGTYQYLILDEAFYTSDTGDKTYWIEYQNSALYNMTLTIYPQSTPEPADGMCGFSAGGGATVYEGTYLNNKDLTFHNTYEATKPAGLGISGSVFKEYEGTIYQSRVYIVNATSGSVVASESAVNPTRFNFTTIVYSIQICLQSSNGTWFNTSALFSDTPPVTPTPTPTVTWTPDPYAPIDDLPIPEGYIRSEAQCVDSETDGAVHGCDIQMYDIQNSSWSNMTGRFDGTWFIDTLPGHYINAYGQADGYSSASRLGVPASGSVMYELFLHPGWIPAAGEGKVRLYVIVNDLDSLLPVNGAKVQVSGSGESTQTAWTDRSGSCQFEWTNTSTVYVSAEKTGYYKTTVTGATTDTGPDTVRVQISVMRATPVTTATTGPGGTTPLPTLDTRLDSEKDADMMDQIRTAGPQLIDLAIFATAMGLLGLIMKSWK